MQVIVIAEGRAETKLDRPACHQAPPTSRVSGNKMLFPYNCILEYNRSQCLLVQILQPINKYQLYLTLFSVKHSNGGGQKKNAPF